MSELDQVKAESEGRRKVLLEKAEALRESDIRVMNLEAERDRLAAEVARLTARWERLRRLLADAISPSLALDAADVAKAVADALDALEREEAK